MRAAIWYANERERGGLLMPGNVDEKSGDQVSEILESKHPIERDVKISSLSILSLVQNL